MVELNSTTKVRRKARAFAARWPKQRRRRIPRLFGGGKTGSRSDQEWDSRIVKSDHGSCSPLAAVGWPSRLWSRIGPPGWGVVLVDENYG